MAKKKSQLKNPQRGFATTSIVKKKEPEPEAEPPQDATTTSNAVNSESSAALTDRPGNAQNNGQSSTNGTSWDDSEEAKEAEEKLAFAERVKNASEKEAARALKTIEYEKRMSSSYPDFRWDDPLHLRDQIIQLALEEEDSKSLLPVKDDEEKLVTKIATISLVLRKLGFVQAQVNQCLRKVPELELESAMNWMHLHFEPSSKGHDRSDSEYQHHGQGSWADVPTMPARKPTAKSVTVTAVKPPQQAPQMSAPTVPKDVPMTPSNGANGSSKPQVQSTGSSLLAYRDPNEDSSDEDDAAPEQPKASTSDLKQSNSGDVQSDDEDDLDPTSAYVAIKLKFTSLERKLGLASKPGKKGGKSKPKAGGAAVDSTEMQEYQRLDARLKEFQRDYLFNQKQADAIFAVERAKLDKQELAERLAGKAKERAAASEATTASPSTSTSRQVSRAPSPVEEIVNGGDDSLFGDMLDDLQAVSLGTAEDVPETNSKGNIIKIRDMSLPKSYTGKTPKSLLEDALRRVDKSAKATYRLISQTRAARAVVSIRWEGGRLQQFGMEDEACETQEQAFHYVATLALFAISSDGSLHRLLPGPYRDLWDELETKKRLALADLYEREIVSCKEIAKYRAAHSAQQDTPQPVNGQRENSKTSSADRGTVSPPRRANEDVLRGEYEIRRSSPSYQAMLPVRQSLPISAYRDGIVSTIEENQVVVLCGETGCGKSTQTPTMILEHALANGRHAKIFCTEPRRISAISLAQRVSQELGEAPGSLGTNRSLIGYNIRLESRVASATRLIYATTGIVLRMLESDTELQEVTHVIIDEVHERSIDSDFLLIILKSLLARRKDLRVILMSATVDAEKIASYMGPTTPVIQVPGRTFPVTPYFLEDAVELSNYRLEMDSDSPYVDRHSRNRGKYSDEVLLDDEVEEDEHSQIRSGYSRQTQSTLKAMNEQMINFDLMLSLLETICFGNAELQAYSAAILVFLPSLDTIRTLCDLLEGHPRFGSKDFQVFPLHSSISNEQQARVFEMPPHGVRKIVVSTNIAETGVTIPDITAVIDSGRHKEMRFDEKRQISKLVECWIARSNALQRRGRAGRVQEGICFHMFTKARLDASMAEHPIPEILRLSLQDLALRIKILKFSGSIDDVLQRALDPPLTANIQRAVSSLIDIKALTTTEEITQLGKHLVKLPLDVYTAKFCLLATLFGCLDAALTIAATLNSKSFFVTPFGREMEADTIKRSFRQSEEYSDFLVMYRAYNLWRSNCENGTFYFFARKHFLSHVTLTQIEELKAQYMSNLVEAGFISSKNTTTRYSKGPRVRFVQLEPHLTRYSGDSGVVMACVAASMHPKLLYKDAGNVWKTLTNNAPVAIHPSSSNFSHGRKADFGNASFLTYFNIQQSKKLYVWENGVVDEKAVLLLCGDVDVKHYAHSASLDRKIRRHLERKSGLAVDLLRSHFNQIWLSRLDAPSRPWTDKDLKWFHMLVQALSSTETEALKEQRRKDKPAVAISVVRQATASDTVA